MGVPKAIGLCVAATALACPLHAGPLKIVEVNAPAVNCIFNGSCTITVSDSTGALPMPYLTVPGTVWLQSRTFSGQPGTPAAGLTGYMYRLSMTQAAGSGDCVLGLVVNFGPVATLPYPPGAPAQVYVITTGGLGSIGLKSAQQDGDVITFEFAQPVCVPPAPTVTATTFFFGLASAPSCGPSAVRPSTRSPRACRPIEPAGGH
jgi:hypothetical protein